MAIGSILQIHPFDFKPSAPPAGQYLLYAKTDDTIYLQDSTGNEYAFGSTTAITSLVGEASGVGPGAATITLSNSAVIGKVLTGFTPGPNSTVLATDTLLQAIQKLQAQVTAAASSGISSLTGDVTGTGPGATATTVVSVGGKSSSAISTSVDDTQAATASNTASTIVKRDASGNFAANVITADLSGNATTATSSGSFTGSLVGDVTGTQGATVVSAVGGKSAASISTAVDDVQAATSINTASTLVERDASGNFAANTITANLTGVASGNEPPIVATTATDYYRGDKTFQPLNKAAVGLENVVNADTTTTANISDSTNKRFVTDAEKTVIGNTSGINTGDQDLSGKLDVGLAVLKSDYSPAHSILVQQSGTGSPTSLQIGNNTLVGRLSGGGSLINDLSTSDVRNLLSIDNVDNTSDANKPVSVDQAAADAAVQSFAIQRANHTGTQPASTISDFNEAAQDSIGGALVDTSTIDLTYDDALNQISASVIPSSIGNTELASGINADKIADGSVSNTEFQFLNGVTSDIQTQINNITSSNTGDVTVTDTDTIDFTLTGQNLQAAVKVSDSTITSDVNGIKVGTVPAAQVSGLAAVATSGLKSDVGLGNVDNTSDANKPVSVDQAAADSAVQTFSTNRSNHTGTQPASTISDFTESAQDAVGGALTDTANIDLTYDDVANTISADLADTLVAPDTYGAADRVGTFEVDQKGRLISAVDVVISIPSTQVSNFTSAAQSVVGGMSVETDSIDLYTDLTPELKADLKISTNVESSGFIRVVNNIESTGVPGLRSQVETGAPVQIGTSNFEGAANRAARSDHVHSHGNQTSGTLHAIVTSLVNGFMSAVDKVKLDAATALNTVSTLVFRDGSGNFAAGNITADLTGNVSGNVTGNVTGNVSGSAASFTGNLVGDVTGTQGATVVDAVGGKTAAQVSTSVDDTIAATSDDEFSTIVKRDSNGDFAMRDLSARRISQTGGYYSSVVALSDGPTINTDAFLGNIFTVTIAGNRTFAAPTNPTADQKITYRIRQDAVGGRTITWDAAFSFGVDLSGVPNSTSPNVFDYYGFQYNAVTSSWNCLAISRGY